MWNGLLELPVWGYLLVTLVLTHITIVSVTVYLHRHQAHRGLELHPAVAHCFRFWLWLTTGMVTREWVAIHRKHHARCETAEDPHSPQVKGIHTVLWRGAELYRQESTNAETIARYSHGTPDDWIERKLYARHSALGVTLMLLIDLALFGAIGLTIWAVQMIWIPFWAAGVINGLGHFWGYRNFEPTDASTNLTPLGILIGGEELHNNHHAFPSSARFSMRRWEFDLGWFYIRLLSALGLARVKRLAPQPVISAERQELSHETVQAIVVNRLHVLSSYANTVLRPTLHREWRHRSGPARRALKRARRLLIRNERLIDDKARQRLQQALAQSAELKAVYEFRARLQAVWERSATSHEALLQNLQAWCTQAEASGIQALREFAQSLRSYRLQAG